MKKYSFRLQTVLEMREKSLEERRLAMAKVIKLLNEQSKVLEDLKFRRGETQETLIGICDEGEEIDILTLSNYKNYLVKVDNDIQNQLITIENTKKVLSEKQFEVSLAHKKLKVLETLKEKQETAFYKAIEQKEAKEIDDIATTRYATKAV